MAITTDPREIATRLGVTVTEHRGGEKGRYYATHPPTISLRRGLGPIGQRVTLAHELGHYVLRHDPAATGWIQQRQERQADEFAAQLLITAADVRDAETIHGPHPGAIAAHLEITTHLLDIWLGHRERTIAA